MNQSPVTVKYRNRRRHMKRKRMFGGVKKKAAPKKKAPAEDNQKPSEAPLEKSVLPPAVVIPEHREDIQAQYHFTMEEVVHMERELRGKLNSIDMLEDQKKAAMQDFKLRITNAENEAKMLRNKLDSGEETRAMRAAVDFDSKRGMKRYLDPQTGVFLSEAPMQPADWQLPMFKKEEVVNEKTGATPPAKPNPKELLEAAQADYPDEEKLMEHFKALRDAWPNQYPGKTKPAFKLFVNDIKECVESKQLAEGGAEEKGQGSTPLGAALDKAAVGSKVSPIILDLTPDDYEPKGLIAAFRSAAKKAGWIAPQIKVLTEELNKKDDVEAMKHTLRPYVKTESRNTPDGDYNSGQEPENEEDRPPL